TSFDGMAAITTDSRALLGVVVGLGMLGTGGAFFCYYFVIEKLGSVQASGATYIAPVVAVIIGAAVGEEINAAVILALVLILSGVVLIQTGKRSIR
ncbi:EamA family transporter, partial [Halomonas piscis]|uniref:EamA family transporter n=1 Tax=Halomonas piscis TaxID=3031727 RepID=UPI0028A04E70